MKIESYINEFIFKALHPSNKTNGHVDSNSHFITLFALTVSLRAKKVLELGCRDGGTTLPLLSAVSLTDGHLTSVDVNQTVLFNPSPDLSNNWTFIQSDSIEYLSNLRDECFDVVYVDDWHSYSHVKKELEFLSLHVNSRSIILMHDLMAKSDPLYNKKHIDNPPGHQFGEGGPYRAVRELDNSKWEFSTIPICNGLTILRKI